MNPYQTALPLIVAIEGNIGAGKSTIFKQLQQHYSNNRAIAFMKEPVDEWGKITDETGENILAKYYSDPAKYAFAFQSMIYISQYKVYMQTLKENPHCRIILTERSMDASRHVFAAMLKEDGMMETIELKIYDEMMAMHKYQLHQILYIDVAPETCYQRIQKRNRHGETGIPLEYLTRCDTFYKKWLQMGAAAEAGDATTSAPALLLDGNVPDEGAQCTQTIIQYIDSLLMPAPATAPTHKLNRQL